MAKLVAFYSRADENFFDGEMKKVTVGNTEKAARMIAKIANADLFKIEQEVPYSPDYNLCVVEAKRDKEADTRPKLISLPESIDQYEEIYLGYPNYWGTMPMAVYTFLESFDFYGKRIYPFCTHEGSGLSDTEWDITRVAKGAIVEKGIAIYGGCVDASESALKNWIS